MRRLRLRLPFRRDVCGVRPAGRARAVSYQPLLARSTTPLRRPTQGGRRIPRLAITAGGTAILLTLLAAGAWMLQARLLRVEHVSVRGTQVADAAAVSAAADVTGHALLRLDTGAAAVRITSTVPAVRAASVRRVWPHGVVIDVVERQAWGYWEAAGRRYVIESDGTVVEHARPPRDGAPTIYEIAASGSLDEGQAADPDTVRLVDRLLSDGTFGRLRVRPTRFEFRHDRGLTVVVANGPAAVFGDSHDYDFKVAAWGALLDRLEATVRPANELDLRFGRQLVVR